MMWFVGPARFELATSCTPSSRQPSRLCVGGLLGILRLQNRLQSISGEGERSPHLIGRIGRAGEIRTRDLLHPKLNLPITTRCPFPTAYKYWKWLRAVETCRYSLNPEASISYILTTVRICSSILSKFQGLHRFCEILTVATTLGTLSSLDSKTKPLLSEEPSTRDRTFVSPLNC